MEGRSWKRNVLGREAKATLCLTLFFVSTEKQRSRDLPSLPNLEPGEGKRGLWVQGWEDPKKPLGWSKRAIECVYGGS